MRILVVGKKQGLRWPETVAETLAKTDDVSLFLYNKRTLSSILHKLFCFTKRYQKDATLLRKKILSFKPDLIFCISCFFIPQSYYDILKQFSHIKKIGWTGDRFGLAEKEKATVLDVLFCSDSGFLPTAKQLGIKAFFLPLCTNDNLFRSFRGKRTGRPIYVGAGNKIRTTYLQAIQDTCDIWGPHWDQKNLMQHIVHRRTISQKKMRRLICQSKLPFNMHFSTNNIQGLNFRTFDVPATGGLILTNDMADLHKCYHVGKEAVTYKTPEELNQLIHDFLQHPQKYQDIIEAGHHRTIKDHTFTKRMDEMKSLLKKQRII